MVEKTFGPLADRVKISPSLMREIGDYAITTITRRTRAGVDVDGRPFQALSPAYAKAKQKAIGSTRADLTVSGRLLNDMRARVVGSNTVEIVFASQGGSSRGAGTFIQRSRAVGAADKAEYHHVLGAGKSRVKRRFFDVSESEKVKITDLVSRYLKTMRGGT
jgi:hypothetical protein